MKTRFLAITRIVTLVFSLVAFIAASPRSIAATCTDTACVTVTGRLASVDTNRMIMLNALMGQMLGTSVSLSAVDWQYLSSANVNLLDVLNALQAEATLGTPTDALNSTVDIRHVLNATVTALQANHNTAAANAVASIAANVNPGSFRLADILDLCMSCTSYADVNLNVLDLVSGSAALFNYRNMLNTPTPITITGASLGLGSVINNVKLYAQVLQPPRIVCSTGPATFYGAAIRVKLDATLVNVDLSAALSARLSALNITIPSSSSGLQVKLVSLGLYADVARVQGTLQTVDAVSQIVTLQAKPGVVDLYLGQIDDSIFFTRTAINPTTDLKYGTIGTLNVTIAVPITGPTVAITAAVKAKARANGTTSTSSMTFNGPFPQQQTVGTGASFISGISSTLLNNLDLSVEVTNPQPLATAVQLLFDTLIALIKGALTTVYSTALSTPLNLLLTVVLNPALGALGIRLGEADITVLGARRRCRYTVSGFVYRDSNRSGFKDDPEAGTGLTLHAKLIDAATPGGPASQAVPVDPTTGAYSFTSVLNDSYRIIIDDNATLSDVTPAVLPAGWSVTEQAGLIRTNVAVTSDLPNQNFGLVNGSIVSGRIFKDTGTGGGTANDGIRNGGEAGIAGTIVQLRNGSTVLDTATSGDDGTFALFIPGTVSTGTVLTIVEQNTVNQISTGASVGTTGGSYNRASDTITFTHTTLNGYSGVAFGDVPTAQFTTDGDKTSAAGTTVYFPHQFIAGSAGSVTFSTTHTITPATDGWTEIIYLDANANGVIDVGEQPVSGPITTTEGQSISLIVKVAIPAAAPQNARNQTVVQTSFAFTNSNPALTQTLTHTDLTTVAAGSSAGLSIVKTVDKASAKPGDTIVYTITFTNDGAGPLRNVVVSDATPAFTRFVSAAAGTTPTSLGAAALAQPSAGATGTVRWTYSGELAPGATGSVTFSVILDQ